MLAASKGHLDLCRLISEHAFEVQRLAVEKADDSTVALDSLWSNERNGEAEESSQTRANDSTLNSSPDGAEFESEFFATWEEEVATEAPLEDPSLRSTIQIVQEVISKHVIVDSDEDWNDLAKLLPSHAEISLVRELNHSSTHGLFEALVHRAQIEGNFNPLDLEVISREIEGDERGDVLRQLTVLMGQIDAVPEDDDEWLPPLHLEQESEPASDSDVGELEQFMQDLASMTNDPYFHFAKIAQSSVLLDRTGEERMGLLLDLSLKDAYRAIAESPHAVASIAGLATDFERGRVSVGQVSHISHISGEDDERASDLLDASDDADDDPAPARPVSGLNLSDMLESARCGCFAFQENPDDQGLARDALAAVSALELTSSTVKRFDKEFRAAGCTSVLLRRAVQRLSRLELEMFHANVRLAVHVADSHAWSTLPRMDRIQECLIGLLKAIDRFDYARGNKFSTYAIWWLKQSVGRAIGDTARVIRLPIHVMEKVNKVSKAVRVLREDSFDDVRAEDIAKVCDLSVGDVAKLLDVAHDAVSWDQQDETADLVLAISDVFQPPEEVTDGYLRRRAIDDCLGALGSREAEVIRHRFGLIDGNDKTLEEVGQIFGVTRERIRQIESKALRLMRHPSRRLRELVNGEPEADDAAEQ
ncbi:sigma-70 family RNA polymerase sigma factor [Stenotrophomonas maltophilia]|uniref:sigma-70 family RNA polymerase sigma factor n=2 Tax=Gammaproteobacteria TaxID=1236 RepID=UPI0015EC6A15|nr:sigma-70 family RNA polymerase sigma factor [Stenotrophomonas maltophilia]